MKNLKLAATALSLTCAAACATAPSASAQNSPAYTQQQPGYNIPGSSPGSSYYTGTAPGSDYYAAPAGNKPVLPGGMHQFGKGGNGTPGGYPATAPLPAHAGGYTGGGPEVRVVSPNAYKSKTWFPNGAPANQKKWNTQEHIPRPYVPTPSTSATTGATGTVGTGVGPGGTYSGSGGTYNYPAAQKKADFDTWAAVQQKQSHAPGPQRVPPGGYIPVMKDNKARKFYNGF